MRGVWGLALLVGLGCAEKEREGDDPGECTDRADNDFDGDFDCDDSDCSGSPDCTLEDTGGGDDTGSADDTSSTGDTANGSDDTGRTDWNDTDTEIGDDTQEDTESDVYTGSTLISSVSWNCDGIGFFWFIDYAGWSASADLWMSQTVSSAWSEYHIFTPAIEDSGGWLSSYEFYLDSVYDQGVGSVVESRTTFFDCHVHHGVMIFQFDLWNEANDGITDCAMFGDNTSGDVGGNGKIYGDGWPGDCNNIW